MSEPAAKKAKTHPTYTLLYHPGLPGRGEYIRLAFAAAQVPYVDLSNQQSDRAGEVYATCSAESVGIDGNPPKFAPPMLKVEGLGDGDLIISQTGNILLYLGEQFNLVGSGNEKYFVNEIVLTALDWQTEAHDTHHPVSVGAYYEDQKPESLKHSTDFRDNRIPKFLNYFDRVLKGNKKGHGKYLVGSGLTTADTTLWHVLTGVIFAFPKEMKAREKEFPELWTWFEQIKEENGVKEYLESGKRLEFGNGIFRHYPELDRQ
jgi:glutathione S-transferase